MSPWNIASSFSMCTHLNFFGNRNTKRLFSAHYSLLAFSMGNILRWKFENFEVEWKWNTQFWNIEEQSYIILIGVDIAQLKTMRKLPEKFKGLDKNATRLNEWIYSIAGDFVYVNNRFKLITVSGEMFWLSHEAYLTWWCKHISCCW